jgi:hypothetical protein
LDDRRWPVQAVDGGATAAPVWRPGRGRRRGRLRRAVGEGRGRPPTLPPPTSAPPQSASSSGRHGGGGVVGSSGGGDGDGVGALA